jgi:putative ABC transport system permease protein
VQDKLDRFGANILVSPRTQQLSLGFGDIALGGAEVAHSRLSMKDREKIASIHHKDRIRTIVPFLLTASDSSGKNLVWMGLPAGDMADARPWWKVGGSPVRKRGEVMLGAEAAAVLDKGPGGTVAAGNRSFRVAGVLHPTGEKEDGMIIADIADVQELSGQAGAVTYFEVGALCKDCPVEDIVAQIGQALPGARVSAIRQVVESRKAAVDQLRRMGYGVSAIVLLIGGLMVLVTVMGGVQERTGEIGVLRAVGFRGRAIFSLLFWETGWVSLLASILGAGMGTAAAYLASPLFGIENPGLDVSPALLGVAAGLALGLLGAVPPARRAAALSPTEAIRSL